MSDIRKAITLTVPIKEMTADTQVDVPLDAALVSQITEGDPDPRFLIVDVDEGRSENKVTYDRPFFENLARQVNDKKPAGYLGHKHFQGLDKEDLLPDPQAVWLGATVTTNGGKSRFTAKGYLLPESEGGKARAWIKRQAINSVSWAGDAVLTLGKDGSYHVKEFFLESIDFARKNKAGMKGQNLRVVTEMEGDDEKVTAEEIAALQLAELQVNNPQLVMAIKEQAKNEVAAETNTKIEEVKTDLEAKHKKEIDEHPFVVSMAKVKELLGIADDENADPVTVLSAVLERLDDMSQKLIKSWFTEEILNKKIQNDKARKLVGRLVPITEMQGADWRSERGLEKIKEQLENKADDLLENDDDIKTVIKEMSASRGGGFHGGGGGDNRQTRDDDSAPDYDAIERRGNLTVKKEKVGA